MADAPTYWLTRTCILRLLALVYLVAFATVLLQGPALFGQHGLTPASLYLEHMADHFGSRWSGFLEVPSLFWVDASDATLLGAGWLGVALASAALLGYANAISMAVLWALQLSFVGIGQDWYAFGWEIQLLETGFLAIFLCPLLDPRPRSPVPPPLLVLWMYRWLIMRIMLGAGLIKLRGDACWRELTCLDYHFETQPIPNPLSPVYDALPHGVLAGGVIFTFVAELVAPWLLLVPRPRARHLAGLSMLGLQLVLITSGNLSFLNWLTIVPILACFDDGALRRVLPSRFTRPFEELAASDPSPPRGQRVAVIGLAVVVALLSLQPVANLVAEHQIMNTSFDRLHLVNTYGAFGTVGRERDELVFEGTRDADITPGTRWREYDFPCKPTDPDRRPCIVSPYHLRLDWLLWFAAMDARPGRYPWVLHLVWKLLRNDPTVLRLIARNPFPDTPPRWIRVVRYRYRFAPSGDGAWWRREPVGTWLPPVSLGSQPLREYMIAHGWAVEGMASAMMPLTSGKCAANHLATEEDRQRALSVIRWLRRLGSQPALADWIVEEVSPGPRYRSDEDLLEKALELGGICFHISGTARMGSDERSVVDPRLRASPLRRRYSVFRYASRSSSASGFSPQSMPRKAGSSWPTFDRPARRVSKGWV